MYGPDDKTTTKIAAGVILHDGAEASIKRWVATDVTTNVNNTFAGAITNSTNALNLQLAGVGTLTLTGSTNSYTGTTSLTTPATLRS